MAEQLRAGREWSNVRPLFALLQALDDVVDAEACRTTRPSATSAAAAGLAGYKMLFGKMPALRGDEWPDRFERVDEREIELATMGLQALGFDPLIIDGVDPAAYLWAMFEMGERQEGCAEVTRLGQHAAAEPRCLAVVPEETVGQSLRSTIPSAPRRELVAAGS